MHSDRLFWGSLEAEDEHGCSGYLLPLFFSPTLRCSTVLFRTSNLVPFSFRYFHLCDPSLLSLPCSHFHFSLSACLIGIILVTYPYLSKSAEDTIYSVASIPLPRPATDGSVPWQANIFGIQNLMGAM
jgi:hypothetical protein